MTALASGRDPRLDLLRIGGAFAVVVMHVSAAAVPTVDTGNAGWWMANVSDALTRWGDAIIMMVSGALLLSRDSDAQPLRFVAGRFRRLLPAVVFWSVFYWVWRGWLEGLPPRREILLELLRGMPYYHMWFLYMMLGMYLALPLLRRVLTGADRRLHYYCLALCAVATVVEGLARVAQDMTHASFIGLFPIYLVYFVGGYLLYRDCPAISRRVLAVTLLVSLAMVPIGVAVLYPVVGERVFKLMYTNRGPLVMLATFCIFLLALRVMPESGITSPPWHRQGGEALARTTLGIYALHPFWIVLLAQSGVSVLRYNAVWAIPAISVLVFALSAITSLSLARVPGLRRMVI